MNKTYISTLDQNDPLKTHREKFELPKGVIYLDGNSLGPLPKSVPGRITEVVNEQWGQSLISSWNDHDWITLPARVGSKIGRMIGAEENSVVCADSTSVNLYKLLSASVRLIPERKVILSDTGNFPNDLYVIQGLIQQLGDGYELRLVKPEEISEALTEDIAVAVITEVDYRTGRRHDMTDITAKAKEHGIKVIWDLCHSAGAFPVDLSGSGAELAVGCSYKYLNGGPGAPAFLYVTPELQNDIQPPLSGWMGHTAPFDFDLDYRPAEGISRNLCGTPGVIAMSALDTALDVWQDVDLHQVRQKSQKLFNLFAELIENLGPETDLTLQTTFPEEQRGSQISFAHPQGYAIMQALIDRGVVGDFRAPDILRFGLTPLYLSYADIYRAVEIIADIIQTKSWDQLKYHERGLVT
ncbi:MAG: kynureninase [Rhodospirillales bacterium]|jgi:kynureninase